MEREKQSNKSIFGENIIGESYFFECEMVSRNGSSRESKIDEMNVKKSENIATFTFEYPQTEYEDEILFEDLLSCSIKLNKLVQVIILYFRGLTMRTIKMEGQIIHEQVDNKHGVGVSVHCDSKERIRNIVIQTDYLKTSLLFNDIKTRIKSVVNEAKSNPKKLSIIE